MNTTIYYKSILIIGLLVIWCLMLLAKFAEYDMNYGFAIFAFIVSFAITAFIILVRILQNKFIEKSYFTTALFLITSSPIAIYSFVEFYTEFIGQYFKF